MAKFAKSNAKKNKLLRLLKKHYGVVTPACEEAGISRTTHYEWQKTDPDYAREVSEIDNEAVDFGESALYNLIKNGDTSATIFYLKTKGKKRGYVERSEHIVATGESLAKRLSPEQAMEILKAAGHQIKPGDPELQA